MGKQVEKATAEAVETAEPAVGMPLVPGQTRHPDSNVGVLNHVYSAIGEVTRKVAAIGISADDRNQQQNFNYRGIKRFLDTMSPILAEAGIFITPVKVYDCVTNTKQTGSGGQLFVDVVTVDYMVISVKDGSRVQVSARGSGMDGGDKATPKAMTSAYKTLLIELFCIPLAGTPDTDGEDPLPEGEQVTFTEMTDNQKSTLRDLLNETGTAEGQFCNWLAEVADLDAMDAGLYERAEAALQKKLAAQQAASGEA